MDPKQVLNSDILDIVFEGRNKAYGAYILRRSYVRTLSIAFAATLLLLVFGFVTPKISKWLSDAEEEAVRKRSTKVVELSEPPPLDEKKPEPELPPPPPVKEQIKFVAPEITKEEVKEEEQLIEQKEIKENVVIGAENVEGDTSGAIDLNPENQVTGDGDANVPVIYAEEMPEFPGGLSALTRWLQDHIDYPRAARDNGVEGRVIVRFVVNTEGKISNVEVIKSVPGLDEEALRVMEEMKKTIKWKVGRQNGKPVAVYYNLPISFVLER